MAARNRYRHLQYYSYDALGRRIGIVLFNLREVTREQYAALDPYRNLGDLAMKAIEILKNFVEEKIIN